jgi:hypothetical protein
MDHEYGISPWKENHSWWDVWIKFRKCWERCHLEIQSFGALFFTRPGSMETRI